MGSVTEKVPEHLSSSRVDAAVAFGSCPPQTSSSKTLLLLGEMSWLVHGRLPSHGARLHGTARAVFPCPEDAALCQAMLRSPGLRMLF